MHWPWVSRERLAGERLHAERWAAECDVLAHQLAIERDRYAALVAVLIEMKREGFQPPERPEQLEEVSGSLPDAVLAAIADRAAPKSDLERDLMKWAAPLVLAGGDPERIARKILVGGDPQEEE